MIELKNINKIYENDFHALKNVNLRIDDGEFVSVCGSSGSGKTTLLNIIGCLDGFESGSYILNGKNIGEMKDGELSKIRNSYIGFVLQDFALINSQTVLYNVMLPLLFGKTPFRDIKNKALSALEAVGIRDQSSKKANQLSGGQRQRVAIARAVVNSPSVILADEPTGQLDSKTGEGIIEVLKGLNEKGITVVIVTHDVKIASEASRIITVCDGEVIV